MTLPSAPTDSLYKFLAISGVAIFISCLYLFENTSSEILKQINDIKLETATTQVEVNFFNQELDISSLELDAIGKESTQKLSESEIRRLEKKLETVKKRHIELNIQKINFAVKAARFSTLKEILEQKVESLMQNTIFLFLAMIGGAAMAIYGFKNWYLKIQVHLDRQIENISNEHPPEVPPLDT